MGYGSNEFNVQSPTSGFVETAWPRMPSHASIARRQCFSSLIFSVSRSSPKKFESAPSEKPRGYRAVQVQASKAKA
jgi:hypothetical protein